MTPYLIYIVSLLICLLVYTPKLKQVSVKKTADTYTVEYLNTYGFYVIIVNLYIALCYGVGFVLYSIIDIYIPFDVFFLSESMLQVVHSTMITSILMLPLSWSSQLLYVKCFKNTYNSVEEAERTVDVWVMVYSVASMVLFHLTRKFLSTGSVIAYSEYTSQSVVLKTFVLMLSTICISSINSKNIDNNEHGPSLEYVRYKRYTIYLICLIGALFFIR